MGWLRVVMVVVLCLGLLWLVWPSWVMAQSKVYCGQNARYRVSTINLVNCATSNGLALDELIVLVAFPAGSYRAYIYDQNNTSLFNQNVGNSSIAKVNAYYEWYENGVKVGLFDTIRIGTNSGTSNRMQVYLLDYAVPVLPTSTPPTSTPQPVTAVSTPSWTTDDGYQLSYISQQSQIVTTTEGVAIPEMSCNVPASGGITCHQFDGDQALQPALLSTLCPITGVNSYALSLEPTCNGSQFRNAQLINFSTRERQSCTSATPDCWLISFEHDEVAINIDVDNDAVGADVVLKAYPLQGGPDDLFILMLASCFSTLYVVFLSSKKVEAFGRGLLFQLFYLAYSMVGGSVSQAARIYYFYLFLEIGFSGLNFVRYKLFALKVRQ